MLGTHNELDMKPDRWRNQRGPTDYAIVAKTMIQYTNERVFSIC